MKSFSSNSDLYGYLVELGDTLERRGSLAAAATVRSATRQATSLSTEFLGESLLALREVAAARGSLPLSVAEHAEIIAAIHQLIAVLGN